jgi:hypothetical protein
VSARLSALAQRIGAATPPNRDRAVDALRALAIAGVIGGHWLVTALVPGSGSPAHLPAHLSAHLPALGSGGTALSDTSPLASMPYLAPLSWVLQTLAVFFLVGGYTAARGYHAGDSGGGYLAWLRRRMARLARPVAVLVAVWIPVTAGMLLAGVPGGTARTLLTLVVDPLWFLGVYAALTAFTPLGIWLVRRLGLAAAAIPAIVVAAADLIRFGLHGPGWIGWVNLPAGWLVPYLLGIAWALGRAGDTQPLARRALARRALARRALARRTLARRTLARRALPVPVLLLVGGAAATAALIAWAGYPASMVGVNGQAISNLNPPTLAAVTFGIAQCGLALLLRGPLTRWMRRPAAWAVVATANLSAMTLFLWHQTAFVAVCGIGLLAGRVPGLLTAPSGPAWIAERLAWLPVFAAMLALLWLPLHRAEHPRSRDSRARHPGAYRRWLARTSARCLPWTSASWSSCVRQEKPSASTVAPAPAERTAGSSAFSATATETS